MPDTFIPLPRPAPPKENAFTPLAMTLFTQPNNQPASADACREPVLSLQRDGDKVTGIRLECSCGQVIDLACDY